MASKNPVTREILRGWLPDQESSLTAPRLARLLDASWLCDDRLFAPVGPLRAAATRSQWRTRVAEQSPVIGAQLVWAARKEMAVTLAEAVIRRTPLGVLECPPDAALASSAAIVGAELGWTEEQRAQEIEQVKAFYGVRS